MATTALAGSSAASSSAPAPGITAIGDVAGTMGRGGYYGRGGLRPQWSTAIAAGQAIAVALAMLAPVTASTTELLVTQAADMRSQAAAAMASTVGGKWRRLPRRRWLQRRWRWIPRRRWRWRIPRRWRWRWVPRRRWRWTPVTIRTIPETAGDFASRFLFALKTGWITEKTLASPTHHKAVGVLTKTSQTS